MKLIHEGFECDNCDSKPIVGLRYKSKKLKDYNLCQKCYDGKDKLGMKNHPFEKVDKVEKAPKKKVEVKVDSKLFVSKKKKVIPVVSFGFSCGHCGCLIVHSCYRRSCKLNYNLCSHCWQKRGFIGLGTEKWLHYLKPGVLETVIDETPQILQKMGEICCDPHYPEETEE